MSQSLLESSVAAELHAIQAKASRSTLKKLWAIILGLDDGPEFLGLAWLGRHHPSVFPRIMTRTGSIRTIMDCTSSNAETKERVTKAAMAMRDISP